MAGLIVLGVLLVSASVIDHIHHKIPNILNALGFLIGLVLLALGLMPSDGWLDSALGMLIGFTAFIGLYIFKKIGAGDVKLMSVVGFYLGWQDTLWAVILSFTVGGVLAIVWIFIQLGPRKVFKSLVGTWVYVTTGDVRSANASENSVLKKKMPYATAIAIGTALAVFLRT